MRNRRLVFLAEVGTIVGTQLATPNTAFGDQLICNGNGTACFLDDGQCQTGPMTRYARRVSDAEAEYHHLTFDLTLAAARTLAELNPGMTFCYVSGQGTDSTEHGRIMWARVKGKTENALLALPLRAYMLRPGYIQPMGGIRSKTRVYRLFYQVMAPLYPVLRRLTPNLVTTNEVVGRAMIELGVRGHDKRILEPIDINRMGR